MGDFIKDWIALRSLTLNINFLMCVAVLGLADALRPGAAAVARLHALGLATVMLSGDNAAPAA